VTDDDRLNSETTTATWIQKRFKTSAGNSRNQTATEEAQFSLETNLKL
jgi:hypothetical protein